jgi:hypothetical protein
MPLSRPGINGCSAPEPSPPVVTPDSRRVPGGCPDLRAQFRRAPSGRADRVNSPGSSVDDSVMGRLDSVKLFDPLREALAGMEHEWRRLGAPIVPRLRPGLSDEQLDDLGRRFGWNLPLEVRVLWGWHDGTDQIDHPWKQSIGPGAFSFLSAEDALQETEQQRKWAPDEPPEEPGWRRRWLLIMNEGPQRLYVDTDVPDAGPESWHPLGYVPHDWAHAYIQVARSLTQAASLWWWILQNDYYAVDSEGFFVQTDKLKPLWMRVWEIT